MSWLSVVFLFIHFLISYSSTQHLSSPPPPVVPLQINETNVSDSAAPIDIDESTNKNLFSPIVLPPFMELAHGLRSGPITILDPQTFFIQDLHYDGKGPDAHFWVGKGSWPSNNGILVPNENNSTSTLPSYTGQNVTIKLPDTLSINQIDYLAVWCIKFKHNFGHTFIRKKPDQHAVQLEPFKQLAHGLRSGPIVVIDKKTFFIPNLYYDGKGPDAHFWVGKGSEPSENGTLVRDENGSSATLSAYTGQNVYITLPNDITTDDIDYFGVWCIKFKHNFGHTTIWKNVTIPEPNGNPLYTFDNKEIIRIQKCCPLNQVLLENGCSGSEQEFNLTIHVHEHNSTHIDDEPILAANIQFVPFVQPITCSYQKYPLDPDEDEFPLLRNGSLMVLHTQQILPLDGYCMETVNLGDDSKSRWVTTAILCFSGGSVPLSSSIFIIYAVGIILSAISLILTALVFIIVREVRDTRGKCIVFYSSSMAVAFICLVSAQFSDIDDKSCKIIAFIIQFFLVSSFTWLTMVSCETYCKIIFHNSNAYTRDRKRLIIYICVGVLVPLLTFVISILIDQIPDIPLTVLKPQFGRNGCWFDDNKDSLPYFYIPVIIAIMVNIGLGIAMKVKLLHYQKTHNEDINWRTLQSELKPMFRSCVILLTLMTLCWIMEIISAILQSAGGISSAIDIINSLQGLFVFIIFVAHRPVSNKICKRRRRPDTNRIVLEDRQINLYSNSNGESNSEFLTKLHRADSTELNV